MWCGWNDSDGYSRLCDDCGFDYDNDLHLTQEVIDEALSYWKKMDKKLGIDNH